MNLRKPAYPDREHLERLKRWPSLKRHWAGKQVRIYSNQWESYWRPEAAGYTTEEAQAGVYLFEDAWARSSHAGPEKMITYRLVT